VNTTLLDDPLDVPSSNFMKELLVDFITSLTATVVGSVTTRDATARDWRRSNE
jgi:hypothetical protein